VPFVEVQGAKVRYREGGTGTPPVVLIHGAGGSSTVWLTTLHRLARVRRTVALDLPGHGRSTGRTATVADWVQAVGATAGTLCLGPSVLVGHSLGGLVALAAARAFPDKVAGLVLVTTAAQLQVSPRMLLRLENEWNDFPRFLEETACAPETPAEVRRRAALAALGAEQEQTVVDFRALAGYDARPDLAALACPTLVVVGTGDQMVAAARGEALAAGIPGAKLVTLRAGHYPMQEQPDAFGAALVDFIRTT
jgi:pimeloyl-ACP methyl ester carboxylesterase